MHHPVDLGTSKYLSLNKTVNPCDNFYEFACGGWTSKTPKPQSEPIWNHWQETTHKINARLASLMRTPKLEPREEAFRKAQRAYSACVETEDSDEESSIRQLRSLVQKLTGWPKKARRSSGVAEIFLKVVRIVKHTGVQPVLKIFPEIDYTNTTNFILYMEAGNLNMPRSILVQLELYSMELHKYRTWLIKTFRYMYQSHFDNDLTIKQITFQLIEFEIKLAKLSLLANKHDRMSIEQLSRETRINWLKMFQILVPEASFSSQDFVVVNSLEYLKDLIYLLKTTPKNTIAQYLSWSIIKDLSRDTTDFMRNLHFLMDSSILGVKSDISRSQECLSRITENIPFAVIPQYVKHYVKSGTKPKVKEMIDAIKVEFKGMLRTNTWLSEETKNHALEKISLLKAYIGFPEWIKNQTLLEQYYQKIEITDNHFSNVLRLRTFVKEKDFAKLKSRVSDIQWPFSPLEVNAYYSLLQNALLLPLGIMEDPFFNPELPNVFNYGALGSLIGHEISHSLDTTGRKMDKQGQLRDWWQKSDILEYRKRSRCFIEQNGIETAGESIADSIGLQISFNVFKKSIKNGNGEVVVPHLEGFTQEQLFFVNFAQLWCEIGNPHPIFNEGEHPSAKQRVLGTLQNSQDFETTFHCKNSTPDKCILWQK